MEAIARKVRTEGRRIQSLPIHVLEVAQSATCDIEVRCLLGIETL